MAQMQYKSQKTLIYVVIISGLLFALTNITHMFIIHHSTTVNIHLIESTQSTNNYSRNTVRHQDDICVCNRNYTTRIFNLGFPKAGTGTLHKLLNKLGCRSTHHEVAEFDVNYTRIPNMHTSAERQYIKYVGSLMEFAKTNNKSLLYYFADSIHGFTEMDTTHKAFSFWPNVWDYRLLNEQYPDSLFILMYRNISNHIRSITNWYSLRKDMANYFGIKNTDEQLAALIYSHYQNVTQFFSTLSPERFIEFDIEHDDVTQLQHYLHCYENISLPHAHKTCYNAASNSYHPCRGYIKAGRKAHW